MRKGCLLLQAFLFNKITELKNGEVSIRRCCKNILISCLI